MWRNHGITLYFLRNDACFAFTSQWRFYRGNLFQLARLSLFGAIICLIVLFAIEIAKRRVIWRSSVILWVTRRRLTIFGLGLLLLWTLQTYLAVSQHKHEILNPHGPLYTLFVG